MVAKFEIIQHITDVGFATRKELARHFNVPCTIRTNGKITYPGSLNGPLSALMKRGDLIAFNNGVYNIFTIPPSAQ